jgi:hypothetical protein
MDDENGHDNDFDKFGDDEEEAGEDDDSDIEEEFDDWGDTGMSKKMITNPQFEKSVRITKLCKGIKTFSIDGIVLINRALIQET